MNIRMCWTCNTEHDLDVACRQFSTARTARAAGTRSGLFGERDDDADSRPIIRARYSNRCSAGDDINEGELIRADGQGGWVHVECEEDAW